MNDVNHAMDAYLTGLRNQHAVETQAIGTIQNQLGRMTEYPDLHAKMQEDKERRPGASMCGPSRGLASRWPRKP